MGVTGLIKIRELLTLNHGRVRRKQGVLFLGKVDTEKKIYLEKQTVLHVFDEYEQGAYGRAINYEENRK